MNFPFKYTYAVLKPSMITVISYQLLFFKLKNFKNLFWPTIQSDNLMPSRTLYLQRYATWSGSREWFVFTVKTWASPVRHTLPCVCIWEKVMWASLICVRSWRRCPADMYMYTVSSSVSGLSCFLSRSCSLFCSAAPFFLTYTSLIIALWIFSSGILRKLV